MIASLPMYLRPENQAAHDSLWALIRAALADYGVMAPLTLSHGALIHDTWMRADLLLGQICNLPYNLHLRGKAHRIGTSDYGLPHAPAGHYYSHFVVRADDQRDTPSEFAHATFAINSHDSHSGWGSAWGYARDAGFAWHNVIATGAHQTSAAAIASGAVDIAAIDAISWRMIQRYDSSAASLRIIDRTKSSPGQTLICAPAFDPVPIRRALLQALTALSAPHAKDLMLRGLATLPDAAYDAVALPEPPPFEGTRIKNRQKRSLSPA